MWEEEEKVGEGLWQDIKGGKTRRIQSPEQEDQVGRKYITPEVTREEGQQ